MPKLNILSGKVFGRLTVGSYVGPTKKGKAVWNCVCECGNTKQIQAQSLLSGDTKSCGCLKQEVDKQRNSLPFGQAALNKFLSQYKANAKTRGLSFELTDKRFQGLTQQPCHYCGSGPSTEYSPKELNGHCLVNGIDRIDNTRGYIEGNIVTCCSVCNYMKRSLSYEDFLEKILKICKNLL